MKKVFTFLLAALLLMSGLTWAQTITWTAADQGYENGQLFYEQNNLSAFKRIFIDQAEFAVNEYL